MKLAEIVKRYREDNRLSLRSFADKCGCSFQYIAKLENGEISNPKLNMVMKLCNGMGIPLVQMMEMADDAEEIINANQVSTGRFNKAKETLYDAYSDSTEKIQRSVCLLLDLKYAEVPPKK